MSRSNIKVPLDAVAKRYGVVPFTVRQWDKLGFPKPVRLRRRLYWNLAELDAWDEQFTDRFGAAA